MDEQPWEIISPTSGTAHRQASTSSPPSSGGSTRSRVPGITRALADRLSAFGQGVDLTAKEQAEYPGPKLLEWRHASKDELRALLTESRSRYRVRTIVDATPFGAVLLLNDVLRKNALPDVLERGRSSLGDLYPDGVLQAEWWTKAAYGQRVPTFPTYRHAIARSLSEGLMKQAEGELPGPHTVEGAKRWSLQQVIALAQTLL